MVLMLLDHSREFFFFGHQVGDPMSLATTSSGLMATRLLSHICAPAFVALAGIAAWLHGEGRSRAETSGYLARRGLFLIAIEVTLVNFAWTFAFPPAVLFLQVIWAIGWSMIALAALIHLSRAWIVAIGVMIVAGHNLLDTIVVPVGSPWHSLWAVLHQRDMIDLGTALRARTSYPILPWIGTIALGYAAGPWFAAAARPETNRRRLAVVGGSLLLGFVLLRAANGYGDPSAWAAQPDALRSVLAFLNLTKYPPSLDFLAATLGVSCLLLAWWDGHPGGWLATLGRAPLFFYLLHLYVLHALYALAVGIGGRPAYEVGSVWWLYVLGAALLPGLWWATHRFANLKRASTRWWIRYL